MDTVTVSSKGQIAIPKIIRDAMNLSEGTRLTLDVRGQEIVLSKEPAWKRLQGAAADRDLMSAFAAFKQQEREHEDSRS
jgi:AbrB family looped-hinge helix DNA binding protein